jgi:hypothetical protein
MDYQNNFKGDIINDGGIQNVIGHDQIIIHNHPKQEFMDFGKDKVTVLDNNHELVVSDDKAVLFKWGEPIREGPQALAEA